MKWEEWTERFEQADTAEEIVECLFFGPALDPEVPPLNREGSVMMLLRSAGMKEREARARARELLDQGVLTREDLFREFAATRAATAGRS